MMAQGERPGIPAPRHGGTWVMCPAYLLETASFPRAVNHCPGRYRTEARYRRHYRRAHLGLGALRRLAAQCASMAEVRDYIASGAADRPDSVEALALGHVYPLTEAGLKSSVMLDQLNAGLKMRPGRGDGAASMALPRHQAAQQLTAMPGQQAAHRAKKTGRRGRG